MRSSISNFKERLRLPRLFFRKPTASEQVHGGPPLEFERPIPPLPWRGLTVIVALVVMGAVLAWEIYCRSIGYGPTLNDNEDLWTLARRKVKPESLVIIGDSRGWFDLDLDEIQKGLGKRPIQLAAGGTCGFPILADLADDQNFHGTIICSIVPRLFFAPPGTPPMERGEKVVRRFHNQTLAQRASEYLAIPLEEHVAFLKHEDLALEALLKRLPIPNRPRGAGSTSASTLLRDEGPRTPFAHDRRMRAARERAGQTDPTNLDPPFHAATAADLHSERRVHGSDWQGNRNSFSRHQRRRRKTPRPRRQDCVCSPSGREQTQGDRRPNYPPRANLGTVTEKNERSRHLF
jgi:hypothetical protein